MYCAATSIRFHKPVPKAIGSVTRENLTQSIHLQRNDMVRQIAAFGKEGKTFIDPLRPGPSRVVRIVISADSTDWGCISVQQGGKHIRFHVAFISHAISSSNQQTSNVIFYIREEIDRGVPKQFISIEPHRSGHIHSVHRISNVAVNISSRIYPVVSISKEIAYAKKHRICCTKMVVVGNRTYSHVGIIKETNNVADIARACNVARRIGVSDIESRKAGQVNLTKDATDIGTTPQVRIDRNFREQFSRCRAHLVQARKATHVHLCGAGSIPERCIGNLNLRIAHIVASIPVDTKGATHRHTVTCRSRFINLNGVIL